MKKLTTVLAVLSFAAAGTAFAAEMPKFETLDADQDGQISVTEAAVHEKLSAAFEKIDANQDGNLSLEEYETAIGS